MIRSHSLVFSDFYTTWYKKWANELKQNKANLDSHKLKANKFWQNATIVQALYERGLLEDGKTGVGFGVGQERLPALFAKLSVKVTATDQDYRTKAAKHWQKHELAFGLNSLNRLMICDPEKFKRNVNFQAVDMRKVPKNLFGKYDFVWSNCALGHLGSIEAGIKFILESAKCLKPGGYAVHTTEVNVINDRHTVNAGDTVIFRPRDIYKLASRLKAAGYQLDPLKLNFGQSKEDQRISIYPQFGNDYSKLQVGGHLITQVVLIISRPKKVSKLNESLLSARQKKAYIGNRLAQMRFSKSHPLLNQIRDYEKTLLSSGMIKPLKLSYTTSLKGSPKDLYLEYQNTTKHPIFGMHERLHTTKPMALATSGPKDRASQFMADDWFGNQPNRPSIFIATKDKSGKWVKADYIRPGAKFAYRVKLDPSKLKKGNYVEKFVIVQEDNQHLDDTEVNVTIKVS